MNGISRSDSSPVSPSVSVRMKVGIDDKAAVLALADVAAKFQRLLEGHPDGGGIALLDGSAPQHQDIDALIGNAVAAQGPRDPPRRMLGIPRLEPRPDALLKDATICAVTR